MNERDQSAPKAAPKPGQWMLSVPTLFGLESLAAREIRAMGCETAGVEDGRVQFRGGPRELCRASVRLRTAERLQIKMGDFQARTFDELFEAVRRLPWPDLLPKDAEFPVNGRSLSSQLHSVPDCQAIVKRAIVEAMRRRYRLERFPEGGAPYRVHFTIIRDRAAVYVDASGEGLHKRGYRVAPTLAPMRETLAAGLVMLSGWRPGFGLWDPFCGSGTIVIEAALIALRKAPGLARKFAAESWGCVPPRMWRDAREEAAEEASQFAAQSPSQSLPPLVGSDISPQAVNACKINAKAAGVSALTRFFALDARDMRPDHPELLARGLAPLTPKGAIVCNPPYGERLAETREAEALARAWAPAPRLFPAWSWAALSALDDFEELFGARADKRRKLYNGMIKCQFYQYYKHIKQPEKM